MLQTIWQGEFEKRRSGWRKGRITKLVNVSTLWSKGSGMCDGPVTSEDPFL